MLSKDRVLLAMNHKEADHVPLVFQYGRRTFMRDKAWRHEFERAEMELKLGLDPVMSLRYRPAWKLSSDVKVRLWREPSVPGEDYPLLFKEYHTKNGVLSQVVRETPDWPHGSYVPLWDDFMLPRSRAKKYLVENIEDLEAFELLFGEPNEKERNRFLQEAERIKRFADEHGILIKSADSDLEMTDAVTYSVGMENMIYMMYRNPGLIHRMLDILLEWNLKYLHQIMEAGVVDVIMYEGWSESFFPPKQYRQFVVPRTRKIIEETHKHGVKVCYSPRKPPYDLLPIFEEIGIDVFWGCDPNHCRKDFARMKNEVGDKLCLWGGVNSYLTLGMGTRKQIEEEVTEAIRTLAPGGGYILSAFDFIPVYARWKNIEHMIKVWRRKRKYPIESDLS